MSIGESREPGRSKWYKRADMVVQCPQLDGGCSS